MGKKCARIEMHSMYTGSQTFELERFHLKLHQKYNENDTCNIIKFGHGFGLVHSSRCERL